MNPLRLLLALVSLVALSTGAWLAYRMTTPPAAPQTATVLPAPLPLPEFSLLDGLGDRFDREAMRGHWSLMFFGFTHCPDICPLTLQVLAAARAALADDGRQQIPDVLFVSVDPERDSVDTVRGYAAHFGPGVTGVTGELAELRKLTDELGIYFGKVPTAGGDYSVDHSAAVLLIDPEARFRAVFGAPHELAAYVHDLPLLMAAP